MQIGLSTPFNSKHRLKFLLFSACLLLIHALQAQVVTIPSANTDDTTNRKPFGCFYGYERTHMLYTSGTADLNGNFGNITKIAFWVNSVSNPAASTPVVIKMKTTSNNSITSSVYADASASATTVFSGNITSSMLSANSWCTITLNTPFNLPSGINLEIFIESNYGSSGGESYYAKQFRHSPTLSPKCEFWEQDGSAPTDYGTTTTKRPNIQITMEANCSGIPFPGNNTLSTSTKVCLNEVFTLSLQNVSSAPGITYQWQHSSNNSNWFNYSNGTYPTYTTTQSAQTYYRCIVTCTSAGGGSDTSSSLQVKMNEFYHCYCPSFASDDADTKIDSFIMGSIVAGSADPQACETYTDNTSMQTTITPGQPQTIHVVNGSCSGYSFGPFLGVYIDYNRNAIFETNELVTSFGPAPYLNSIPDKTFFVSQTAPSGLTGMRVILQEGDAVPGPCGDYTFGETEDYLVNITASTACNSTPVSGTAISSQDSVCPDQLFTLSLASYPSNSGIAYQWQKWDGIQWNNITGATQPTYTTSQTAATQYRVNVTCINSGGGTAASSSVTVNMNQPYACYCISGAILPQDTKIDSVIFGTIISGTPTDECETYTNNASMSTDLIMGDQATIKIRNGSCTGEFDEAHLAIYIDYDHSYTYEANELVLSYGPTTGINTIPDTTFIVSSSAIAGLTGMRIILAEVDSVPGPCGTYDYGETEDYAVNLIAASACTVPPEAGSAMASLTAICTAQNITLSLVGNSTGSGLTYQWQSSPDGISNWNDLPSETSVTAVVLTSVTTYYRCKVTCFGNTDTSASVGVIVNGVPVGNTIGDPIIIPAVPYSTPGNNLWSNCYTSDYCCITAQPSPDIFYFLTFDTTGTLDISTCDGTVLNTYLHLLDSIGGHIDSNDNNGAICNPSNFASLTHHVDYQPSKFYIVVEGHANDTGFYQLDVNFTPDSFTQLNTVNSLNPQVSVYPNPASDNFMITMNTEKKINDLAVIKLYNMISQVAQEQTLPIVNGKMSGEIEVLPTIADGIYLLEISYGSERFNQRVVIQH